MAQFSVTASELRRKVEELRQLNTQFRNEVTNLESTEANLKGQWVGEANEAFHNAFMSDKNQMDNFAKLIDEYCTKLEEIARQYEEAEARNAETARTRTY